MNPFELAGFAFGIFGIWLTIRENVWCFPIGLLNVIISLALFYQQKLYADTILQGVYILLLAYGWINWRNKNKEEILSISFSSAPVLVMLLVLSIIFSVVAGFLFKTYTDASLPYWDSSATALSFAAQWMIAKKKIENWLVWMVVNVMYTGIYLYKDLWLYTALFAIYFLLAVKGWYQWKKLIHFENAA